MLSFGYVYPIKGLGFSNAYLVEREHYCVLIDTGHQGGGNSIIQAIKSFCPDKPLKGIILTHYHYDHMAGLESLGQLYGADIYAHLEERDYITRHKAVPRSQGFLPAIANFISRIFPSQSYPIDRVVTEGDVIFDLKVIHTPGHTPGSIALEDIKTGAIFTGDSLKTNRRGTKILPPSRLYSHDYDEALKSAIRLLNFTEATFIFPGHGRPIESPKTLIKTFLDKHE